MADAESALEDLTVSYEWTDASGAVLDSTEMLDTSALSEGDVVTCTVTADDGNMQTSASADATLVTNELTVFMTSQ